MLLSFYGVKRVARTVPVSIIVLSDIIVPMIPALGYDTKWIPGVYRRLLLYHYYYV